MNYKSLLASFSNPVLFERADIGDFSDSIKQSYKAAWLYVTPFKNYGTIEVINHTSIPIICGTESIDRGERGLFWSSFSHMNLLDSTKITISNTFNKMILGKDNCIFLVNFLASSRDLHSKITFSESKDKSEEYISGLIEQFKRFRDEFIEGDKLKEHLFAERKNNIPEFISFLKNSEEFEIKLRANGVLIYENESEPAYHHEEIMGK
ncbi:MAG: hypothetical protein H0V82_10450 [Candidatus Protochlamydia sp.]|nr:hypothetical protein [Candidatus Protochlamydia sp.]